MKKEQLEARKSEIVARLNELKRDVAPVGNRILTFQAIGLIAGVVWAWKTKQKWYIKPIAGIGGAMAANLISSMTLSNDSSKKAPPYTHRRTPHIRLHCKTILTTPHTNRTRSEHVKQF